MSSEKTEEPTPKKLRDARKKGQVAKSQDVVSAALIVGCFVAVSIFWPRYVEELKALIVFPAAFYQLPFEQALSAVLKGIVTKLILLTLPFLAIVIIGAIATNFFQVGALLVFEPIKPELKKLNPIDKAKQLFSAKNFFEFGKSAVKVLLIGIVVWVAVQRSLDPLIKLPYGGRPAILSALKPLLSYLAINITFAYVIIAAADYFFQKFQFVKQLKMSKDEVKREYKEMEGDPMIKSKRKQLHQEMVMGENVARTRKATVVVTNPTHLAVALYYKEEENQLPRVLAKGEDYLARRMVEAAHEEGIPVMQHIPLARSLHETVDIDRFIPSDLIEPMAEVLRWVKEWQDSRGYTA